MPFVNSHDFSTSSLCFDRLLLIDFSTFFKTVQVRLPTDARDDVEEDPTGVKALWDRGLLSGASQKVFKYVNEMSFLSLYFMLYCAALSQMMLFITYIV